MVIEVALIGKFVYDLVKRLRTDKVFRTLGFLVLVLVLVGTMFFWLAEGMLFLDAMYFSVRSLSMDSPDVPLSAPGKVFCMLYIIIGVGVYLTFVLEAAKTIISAHHDFEKKTSRKESAEKGSEGS